MKRLSKVLAFASLALFVVAEDAPPMEMPKPVKEHEWLKQVEGEWAAETELNMGEETVKTQGTMTGRLVGGFWATMEVKGPGLGGAEFKGIMTVGYAPEKKAYVGTWIDSMTSILWTYTGKVEGKTLTLEARGPGHDGKETNYRESLEITDADHMVFTSRMEMGGQWVQILRTNYTRKK